MHIVVNCGLLIELILWARIVELIGSQCEMNTVFHVLLQVSFGVILPNEAIHGDCATASERQCDSNSAIDHTRANEGRDQQHYSLSATGRGRTSRKDVGLDSARQSDRWLVLRDRGDVGRQR